METIYRKVAVSERMPLPMTDILIKYRWNNYFEPYHYFDDLHCKDEMLNEVTHWLEEIPDTTAQLKADKAELLEILNETFLHITPLARFLKEPYQTGLKSRAKSIESLIQKHKQ